MDHGCVSAGSLLIFLTTRRPEPSSSRKASIAAVMTAITSGLMPPFPPSSFADAAAVAPASAPAFPASAAAPLPAPVRPAVCAAGACPSNGRYGILSKSSSVVLLFYFFIFILLLMNDTITHMSSRMQKVKPIPMSIVTTDPSIFPPKSFKIPMQSSRTPHPRAVTARAGCCRASLQEEIHALY